MTVSGVPKGKQRPNRGVPPRSQQAARYYRVGSTPPNGEVEYFMPMQYGSEGEQAAFYKKSESKPLVQRVQYQQQFSGGSRVQPISMPSRTSSQTQGTVTPKRVTVSYGAETRGEYVPRTDMPSLSDDWVSQGQSDEGVRARKQTQSYSGNITRMEQQAGFQARNMSNERSLYLANIQGAKFNATIDVNTADEQLRQIEKSNQSPWFGMQMLGDANNTILMGKPFWDKENALASTGKVKAYYGGVLGNITAEEKRLQEYSPTFTVYPPQPYTVNEIKGPRNQTLGFDLVSQNVPSNIYGIGKEPKGLSARGAREVTLPELKFYGGYLKEKGYTQLASFEKGMREQEKTNIVASGITAAGLTLATGGTFAAATIAGTAWAAGAKYGPEIKKLSKPYVGDFGSKWISMKSELLIGGGGSLLGIEALGKSAKVTMSSQRVNYFNEASGSGEFKAVGLGRYKNLASRSETKVRLKGGGSYESDVLGEISWIDTKADYLVQTKTGVGKASKIGSSSMRTSEQVINRLGGSGISEPYYRIDSDMKATKVYPPSSLLESSGFIQTSEGGMGTGQFFSRSILTTEAPKGGVSLTRGEAKVSFPERGINVDEKFLQLNKPVKFGGSMGVDMSGKVRVIRNVPKPSGISGRGGGQVVMQEQASVSKALDKSINSQMSAVAYSKGKMVSASKAAEYSMGASMGMNMMRPQQMFRQDFRQDMRSSSQQFHIPRMSFDVDSSQKMSLDMGLGQTVALSSLYSMDTRSDRSYGMKSMMQQMRNINSVNLGLDVGLRSKQQQRQGLKSMTLQMQTTKMDMGLIPTTGRPTIPNIKTPTPFIPLVPFNFSGGGSYGGLDRMFGYQVRRKKSIKKAGDDAWFNALAGFTGKKKRRGKSGNIRGLLGFERRLR